VEGECQLLVF